MLMLMLVMTGLPYGGEPIAVESTCARADDRDVRDGIPASWAW